MALSTVESNNRVVKFKREVLCEYVRGNLFSPYMGSDMTSVIRLAYETKEGGEQINCPLVAALSGTAISTGTLAGNEEEIDDYGMRVWIDWARNAVTTNKRERHADMGRVFDKAQPLLTDWGKSLQRDEIIQAAMALPSTAEPANLGSANGQRVNGILYEAATAGNRDTWNAANSDRVLYGNTTGNYNAVHATALANVDTTNDLFVGGSVQLLKIVAKAANPKIRPIKVANGYEHFVAFVGSRCFKDVKADLKATNQDARPRDVGKNPVFQDGDLVYDGVIVREVPEIDDFAENIWTSLNTAGAASAQVYPVFLCGQQAICMPWGQNPAPTRLKEDDYGFKRGIGIEMAYGVAKMFKKHPKAGSDLKQWGMVTGFFCASGL